MTINQNRQGEEPKDDRNNAAGAQQENSEQMGDSLSGSIQTGQGSQQSAGHGNAQRAGQPMPVDPEEKPAEELTPDELRLMADTMPGEGPGDD